MKKYSGVMGALGLCLAWGLSSALAQDVLEFGKAPVAKDSDAEGSDDRVTDRRVYVSPMFSYTLADRDRGTKDGLGGTVSIGKRFTSGLNLELTGFYTRMDAEEPPDQTAKLTGIGIGAMLFPSVTFQNLYALVALHQGQGDDHPTTSASPGFSYRTTVFDTGIGYALPLSPYIGYEMALRAEARYRMDAHNRSVIGGEKESYDGVFNIGVMVPLGDLPVQEAPAETEVVEAQAPVDTDGDGISDDLDQCPDTAAGTAVNEQGCEGDTDADGVVDRLDTCPDTAAGTPVNEQGCTAVADADADGVPDGQDTCPDTSAGTTVNETGCEVPTGCRAPAPGEPIDLEGCATGESVVLKGVNFDVNSSRLTANAKVILNQVADALAAQPNVKVEIGGHTDAQGSDSFNQKLSERRARSVYDYLVSRGIDASRMTAKGYGESQPVDSNETPEGRENNRRVELKVVEGGSAAADAPDTQ